MTEPDIRFTLANERTFLAWLRTAIALVAAGVAVFHLIDDGATTRILALVLLACGGLAGAAGLIHFRQADRAIRRDEPLPTDTLVVTLMTVAVMIAVVVGVLSVVL